MLRDRPNHCRIVLTGGPGGGKTTAADLFRREIGERVVVVPEAATMLFSGGFPRVSEPDAAMAAQRAIFHVQRNLEDLQAARFPGRVLLCDRGTVDGAAYWPGEPDAFFAAVDTSHREQLERYDAVIFFESAAAGGMEVVEGGNLVRTESIEQARALDQALRACGHPTHASCWFPTTAASSRRSPTAWRPSRASSPPWRMPTEAAAGINRSGRGSPRP